jgi:hypothetical protein
MDNREDETIGSFYMGHTRPVPERKRRLPPGVLAMIVLAAFAGILWYAYPRGAEKYTDIDVPVVKADTAPIKEEPENPGGMEVPHQDSAAFDPVTQKPAKEVEKLRPTAEEPLDKAAAIQAAEKAKLEPKMDMNLQMKEAEERTAGMKTEPVKPAEVKTAKVKEAPKKEVKQEKPIETEVSNGKIYIQLGAYRDMAGAKKDWEKLKKKNPQLLGKLDMRTERVELPKKGVFYRLQAGKMTEARAKDVCAALKKANTGGCIVVK